MRRSENILRATAAVVVASVLFGTTGTTVQLGPDSATPLGVGAVRLIVGGTTLALVAWAVRPSGGRSWRPHLGSSLLGGVMVAVYQLSFFSATRHAGVAVGTVCTIASGPVFAGALDWLRTRRVPTRRWIAGTALCIVGVVLLGAIGQESDSVELIGVAAALLSGFGYACYASVAKHQMDRGLDPAGSMAALFLIGGLLSAPLLLVEPLGWIGSLGGSSMAAHLGIVTVGIAYTMYGRGLRVLPTPTVVTITLIEPVTAAILSVIVLDEVIAPIGWVGMLVVLGGLAVASRTERIADLLADTVPA